METYSRDDVQSAIWGATLLGGGGGNLSLAFNLFSNIPPTATFSVAAKSDLTAASRATSLSLVGLPVPSLLQQVEQSAAYSVNLMAESARRDGGGSLTGVLPAAINPTNTVLAFATAGALAVIDADGSGSGASDLSQLTFSAVPTLSPAWIASRDQSGNYQAVAAGAANAADTGGMLRAIAGSPPYSDYGAVTAWRLSQTDLGQYAIWGSISMAKTLGSKIMSGASSDDIVSAIAAFDRTATKLVTGPLAVEAISTAGGISRWRAAITARDGETVRIYGAGENLTFWPSAQDAGPSMIAPVSFAFWNETRGQPFSSVELLDNAGSTTTIIAVAAAPQVLASTNIMAAYVKKLQSVGYGGIVP